MKITTSLFEAYIKCPTKCWLRFTGEPATGNDYAEWEQRRNESYRNAAIERLRSEVPKDECAVAPAQDGLKTTNWRLGVGIVTTSQNLEARIHAVERVPSEGRGKSAQFIPIRFVYNNKLGKDEKLLLAFEAFVLSEIIGREINLGKIIHGDNHSALNVKTLCLADEVRKRVDQTVALLSSTAPPDLVLNRHCAECEFRTRCRQKAAEADDLSLLAGMTEKDRKRLRSKGIFTVTQLSYTFRPRRRAKRLRDKREKYHPSLKALAIREQKTHIIGKPELKIEGTPVYLDVEGIPDRDFYYLIGVRINCNDSISHHSLWADGPNDEEIIWRRFIDILNAVKNPILICYGHYERTFLKRMAERYGKLPEGSAVAASIARCVNLLSAIFAHIYFPVYSNRLKEIGSLLGAKWQSADASGLNAIAWRCEWEDTRASMLKDLLIAYNRDDCAALEVLLLELLGVIAHSKSRADVDFADAPKMPATERAAEIHKTLKNVLRSAYSDYGKARIALRATFTKTDPVPPSKHATKRPCKTRKLPAIRGRTIHVPRKRKCQRHPEQPTVLLQQNKTSEHRLLDLAFTKSGCRKTIVTYVGLNSRCPHCNGTFPPPIVKRVRNRVFGGGFHAWVVYLRHVLRLSYRLITKATKDLFGLELTEQTAEGFVTRSAAKYRRTEDSLLGQILKSPAVHVDETRISILGAQQYVWVITDGKRTIFRLTESRETDFLRGILGDYKGVLVSDFYGGYDALPYRQQKCLVHLIGDLNDDLWKNPFNIEFEDFVASVRDLLVPILADVQKFGLKAYHLRKHLARVERFYTLTIQTAPTDHELVTKYRKRFERYNKSMFTFLDTDCVSWNNNSAERALRHFAVQRKISGAFTSRGAKEYLRLLGISQSCRFQDKSFLGFLLSGLLDLDQYEHKQRRSKLEQSEWDAD
jgi:predicted RecB family nuclease